MSSFISSSLQMGFGKTLGGGGGGLRDLLLSSKALELVLMLSLMRTALISPQLKACLCLIEDLPDEEALEKSFSDDVDDLVVYVILPGHDTKNDEENGRLPMVLLWDGADKGGGGFRKYFACSFSHDADDLITSHSCSRYNISGHESVKDAGKVLLTTRVRGGGGGAGALTMIFLRGGGE